jgi:hypothetical protein
MSPDERAEIWMIDLARKLREDIAAARAQACSAAEELARDAGDEPARSVMAYVSVCADRAYTALEAGFRRIAQVVDRSVPSGEGWHAALLNQMMLPIQDRRPKVLSATTVARLEALRLHRHWLRHSYVAGFEWTKLAPVARGLNASVEAAAADIEQFLAASGVA